jgi:hypothetical protein
VVKLHAGMSGCLVVWFKINIINYNWFTDPPTLKIDKKEEKKERKKRFIFFPTEYCVTEKERKLSQPYRTAKMSKKRL